MAFPANLNTVPVDAGADPGPVEDLGAGPQEVKGEDALRSAGYTGSEQRCGSCAHFSGDQCEKFGAAVEEGGHCDAWNGETPEGDNEAAESAEQDLEDVEEVE